METKTVRKFSPAGPCFKLGALVSETAHFVTYRSMRGDKRISKTASHTDPCNCCLDHPRTQYPDGYQD